MYKEKTYADLGADRAMKWIIPERLAKELPFDIESNKRAEQLLSELHQLSLLDQHQSLSGWYALSQNGTLLAEQLDKKKQKT